MKRLVILAPTWLGDSVMAQPALADLRRALPDVRLAVATDRPAIASLFGMVSEVSEVVPVDSLSGRAFEAALLLPHSFHAALVAYRAGIPERWGYRTDWRGALLTRAIDRASGVHQVASYQQLVSRLGFPTVPAEPRVAVSQAIQAAGSAELGRVGWNGRDPLVALAPGAAYGAAKRWPLASFAGLARSLAADGIRPVLVGGAADQGAGREILRGLRGDILVLNTIGNDIPGLAGVLVNCRALVSNDSGAMHLGAAIGVSVTALFGPTDERLTRPLGVRHTVLTHPTWCRPCMLRECPLDHGCMRGIGIEGVADTTRRTLNASY